MDGGMLPWTTHPRAPPASRWEFLPYPEGLLSKLKPIPFVPSLHPGRSSSIPSVLGTEVLPNGRKEMGFKALPNPGMEERADPSWNPLSQVLPSLVLEREEKASGIRRRQQSHRHGSQKEPGGNVPVTHPEGNPSGKSTASG